MPALGAEPVLIGLPQSYITADRSDVARMLRRANLYEENESCFYPAVRKDLYFLIRLK